MLITLQSNSDSDAMDFVNYFRETVQIPERAEVALLGCSYKFTKSFTVTALNQDYEIKLGDSGTINVQVPQGEYTVDTFLTALSDSLTVATDAQDYRILKAYPPTAQSWAYKNANKSTLVLTLHYAPVNWDETPVLKTTTDTRREIDLTSLAQMTDGGPGILLKTSISNSYDEGVNAGTNTTTNIIWGDALGHGTGETPHGVFRFQIPQDDAEAVICLKIGSKTTAFGTTGDWDFAIHFGAFKTYMVRERFNGGINVVSNNPIAYQKFDFFEIRLDQTTVNSQNVARIFQKAVDATNFIEVTTLTPVPDRLQYQDTTKFVPGAGVKSPIIVNGILPNPASIPASTGFSMNCVHNGLTITTAGQDYLEGELCVAEGSVSNAKADIRVSVNGSGAIQSFTVSNSQEGFQDGEDILIEATVGQGVNGTLTYSSPVTDADKNLSTLVGGSNYSDGLADIQYNGGLTTITDAVNLTTSGGGVTDFGWASKAKVNLIGSDPVLSPGVAIGDVITIVQGGHTNASFTVENLRQVIPQIQNLGWSTTSLQVDEPLGEQNTARFDCDAEFSNLTGLPRTREGDASGPLEIEGTRSIGTDRETQQMLINIEEFGIKSICKEGGVQKAIAVLPYGSTEPAVAGVAGQAQKIDGQFYYEPYNMVYHKFENPMVVNHNQLRVRMTDALGLPLNQLQHPVTVTLDLRPRAN